MTQPPRHTPQREPEEPSRGTPLTMAKMLTMLALVGSLFTGFNWAFGGLRPQSQVDADDFRRQLTSIQQTQVAQAAENKAAQERIIAAQADQKREAQATLDKIMARLEAMPRPSDYAQQDAHLGRLDSAVQELRELTTDLRHDLDSFVSPRFRQSR